MCLDPTDDLGRPSVEPRSTRVAMGDGREDYSDISSVAEDDVEMSRPAEVSEGAGEDLVVEAEEEEEEWDEQYAIGKVRNTAGDEVYLFSQLYIPAPEVLVRYRKQSLAQRVKSGKDLSIEEAYQQYKRACREYRTRLGELYAHIRPAAEKTYPPSPPPKLFTPDPTFHIRLLQTRLRQLANLLEETPQITPSSVSVPKLSPQAIYIPPASTYHQVLFDLPHKPMKRDRSQDEIAYKYSDQPEEILFKKQVLVQNESGLPLYLNKITDDGERKVDSLLEKLKSSTSVEKTSTGEAVILRRSFLMEFRKQPGKPGRIEKCANPIHTEDTQTTHCRSIPRVFSIRKPENAVGIPTRLNTELGTYQWLQLVLPEQRPAWMHKDTCRLIYNLADGRMKFEIPERQELAANKEDAYSRNSSEDRRLRLKEKTDHINEALRNNSPDGSDDQLSDSAKSESNTTNLHVIPTHQSRITTLKHAKPAYDYIYLKKDWPDEELRSFHRPPFLVKEPVLKVRITPREPALTSTSENITAHNLFKSLKSLSLRKNAFALFEYIEKRPHLLGNFGMASKLKRYFKGPSSLCEFPAYVGDLGIVKCLEGEENIPLIGQLQEGQSIAVLENNMTRTPVFAHVPRTCDFILIRKIGKRGRKYYLRPLERIYCSGQQEPRKEVFIPKSRNTNTFLQNRNHALIVNLLRQRDNKVTMLDLCHLFPNMNESTIRKTLKQMGCEQARDQQFWCHPNLPSEQQLLEKVSPEDVCQYESMRAGQLSLQDKGISITSTDKLENAVKKVKSELNDDDRKTKHLANWIEEQLLLTPWNLTSSYISTKQSKGMMKIEGEGDPTSGHCGYSFIKVPMKLPHGDRGDVEGANDPSKYLSSQRIVTGTDADLRKLSMNDLMKKLMTFGVVKREKVEGLTRWERVGLLKYLSSQAAKEGKQGSITKYARGTRLTTKMMREEYQKTVNETFERMIVKLGRMTDYRAEREEEDTAPDLDLNRLPGETPTNVQKMDFLEDVERKDQEDLEALRKEVMKRRNPEEPSKAAKIRVLRKETRVENLTDKTITIKVQYIRDPKEIEEYERKKREEDAKEQLANLPKGRKTPATIEDSLRMEKGEKQGLFGKDEGKRKKEEEGESQITCSRCGQKGHMKTNRKCPMYTAEHAEPSEAERKGMIKPGAGLKMMLSLPLIDSVPPAKKPEKRQFSEDYLRPKAKPRRRALPDENQYDDITHRLFMRDIFKYFHRPVKKEEVPDYYNIVQTPICLQDISTKAKGRRYTSAQMYVDDLNQLVTNAELYNGYAHEIALEARKLREEGLRMLREKELLVEIPLLKEEKEEQITEPPANTAS